MPARALIIFAWVVFILFWAISSITVKKVAERQSFSRRFWYALLLVVAVFLMGDVFDFAPFNQYFYALTWYIQTLGVILAYAGLVLCIWARVILGGNWSGSVTFKEGHELITRGPYEYVRHPIYSGLMLMFIGSAVALGQVSSYIAVVVLFVSFVIKLRMEEEMMHKHFGEKYAEYKKHVAALIPHVL